MTTVMAGEAARLQYPGTCPRPQNLAAREITGRTYLSHSQLACMRACPRQFAFKYSEKAPADFTPSGLVFGACIHTAIQNHFLALQDAGIIDWRPLAAATVMRIRNPESARRQAYLRRSAVQAGVGWRTSAAPSDRPG